MVALTRIDIATHSVIRAALSGPKTPLASLATSLNELREDPSWTDREIFQVQRNAYRPLTRQSALRRAPLERA